METTRASEYAKSEIIKDLNDLNRVRRDGRINEMRVQYIADNINTLDFFTEGQKKEILDTLNMKINEATNNSDKEILLAIKESLTVITGGKHKKSRRSRKGRKGRKSRKTRKSRRARR